MILIKNATVINEGSRKVADVLIDGGLITKIDTEISHPSAEVIEAEGYYLMPGVIDDQVHFRDPGLTHKADIYTESRAAVAGGVTSFMEMPNTKPPTLTQDLLEEKYAHAGTVSPANYSFFMGVSNENSEEVLKTNAKKNDVCGVKIFMGSSTGNMLVDDEKTLREIFGKSELLIATHCEDESVIAKNREALLLEIGEEEWTSKFHPIIRDVEGCYSSSSSAVSLAEELNTRLHILHISTAKELELFRNDIPLTEKRITSEVCVHHLTFTSDHYSAMGNLIKCNPAIKEERNKHGLWEALLDDRLDIIATDHAPHTLDEKSQKYYKAPAGIPLIQHTLLQMLEHSRNNKISLEKVVQKMSHAPAECFQLKNRGFIREGYAADLVIVDPNTNTQVTKENILYKCGWSPFEGKLFSHTIHSTFVNGIKVYEKGSILASNVGQRLQFDR